MTTCCPRCGLSPRALPRLGQILVCNHCGGQFAIILSDPASAFPIIIIPISCPAAKPHETVSVFALLRGAL